MLVKIYRRLKSFILTAHETKVHHLAQKLATVVDCRNDAQYFNHGVSFALDITGNGGRNRFSDAGCAFRRKIRSIYGNTADKLAGYSIFVRPWNCSR